MMSGRHRRAVTTPARRALLGTVPVVGAAGVLTGVLGGAAPEPAAPVAVASTEPTPPTAPGPGTAWDDSVPGHGEAVIDVVAGAQDAVQARQRVDARAAERVSTVAGELRDQAAERAEQARADGDAELAAYLREEAQRQEHAAASSRPVVPADEDPVTDPGETCTSTDLLRLGPLAVAGPDDPQCETDPWVADQMEAAQER
ncbi:hypothetical protein JOF36_003953 [Pseudonocardia parietis]|uniref:Secreted protein n=2 Tax=Pseudonocardia parietis TaxID=570936 RepID=A0ABS4VWD9_9PSEU|nr:hypothetical protein [Pseudonocardia parietis]